MLVLATEDGENRKRGEKDAAEISLRGCIHSAEHILSHDVGFGSYFRLACLLAVYSEEMGDMVLMTKKNEGRKQKQSLV